MEASERFNRLIINKMENAFWEQRAKINRVKRSRARTQLTMMGNVNRNRHGTRSARTRRVVQRQLLGGFEEGDGESASRLSHEDCGEFAVCSNCMLKCHHDFREIASVGLSRNLSEIRRNLK